MSVIKKILFLVAGAMFVSCAAMYAVQSPNAVKDKKQGRHDFTVVIDAGHGGHDVGATDNGIREKDVNLGVAKQLAEMLAKKRKDVKVVMTRDKDEFISLQERANIANRNRGDLFISIHTNSLDKKNSNRKKVEGSSVYALGLHKDADNLKVAQRENSVIEYENDYEQKYSGFDPKKDESYIIFEMAQKRNLGHSLKFAGEAQKQLVNTAKRADRGVKQAGFWVLWATSMPAVLVELDFICNPNSAKFIGSAGGQQKMAEALFNAIENYEASVNPGSKDKKSKNRDNSDKKKKDMDRKHKGRSEEVAERQSEISAKTELKEESKDDAVPVLASSFTTARVRKSAATTNENKEERSYNYSQARTHNRSLPVGQRKRRSASGRRASENRNMTGATIELRSETDLLAKVEEKKVEVAEPVVVREEPVDKKSKKKKDKKKDKKQKETKSQKKSDSRLSAKSDDFGKETDGKTAVNPDRVGTKSDQKVTADSNQGKKVSDKKAKKHTSLAGKRNREKTS